ncbi:MAG: glycosyltransferase [Promicromonosporaceae bacterium]|nr:glycosyltransferase [Promicromonosporaceae bacterium]
MPIVAADQNPLVSIVVPVYNAAATLRRTVATLSAQTWPNLEVVIIDDGSTDGSSELLVELAAADPRCRVIRQANGGVWAARLAGIDAASGQWLAWCDADDLPHPSWIEDLVECAVTTGAQMAVCPYRRVDVSGNTLSVEGNTTLPSPLDPLADPVGLATVNTALWNKVFRMDVVRAAIGVTRDGLVAPRIGEDLVLYTSFLTKIDRIAFTREPRYDYVVRSGSLMTTFSQPDAQTLATQLRALRASASAAQQPLIDVLAFMHLAVAPLHILAAGPRAESSRYARWARQTLRRDFNQYTVRARTLRGPTGRLVAARALFRLRALAPILRLTTRHHR